MNDKVGSKGARKDLVRIEVVVTNDYQATHPPTASSQISTHHPRKQYTQFLSVESDPPGTGRFPTLHGRATQSMAGLLAFLAQPT